MFRFSDAFEDQVQISLKEISYGKDEQNGVSQSFQIKQKDNIEIVKKEKEKVLIVTNRHIYFEPSGLYSISVSYEIAWKPKNWNMISETENSQIVRSMIEEKKEFLLTIASRTSLLIAQITSSVGLPPLITMPEFKI